MGHVPSHEAVKQHFYVDVKMARAGWEHLVAVALTKHNFPSKDDPLFRKFLAVRSEPNVRYWYCNPQQPGDPNTVMPDAPDAEAIYQKYVVDATDVVDLNLPPSQWIPIPIVMFRIEKKGETLLTADNCTVVGYFGVRHFGANGVIGTDAQLGLFLGAKFQNEAKAMALVQVAAKC